MKRLIVLSAFLLAACTLSAPPPITALLSEEFTLTPGQSVTIADAGLIITMVSISSDQRCPLEIECAMSGPVSLSVSVRTDSTVSEEFSLQTFTDTDGRVPELNFETMQESVEVKGYTIHVVKILPFPQKSVSEIGEMDYWVSFTVTE